MSDFRKILADGDLISQKQAGGWWLFGEKSWAPYRNLSREVRFLEQRMHEHHALYRAAQEDFVVGQKNVSTDIDFLRKHKSENSEVIYIVPSDESILSRRDGIKYGGGSGGSGKQQPPGDKGNGNHQPKSDNHAEANKQGQGNPPHDQNKGGQRRGKSRPLIDVLIDKLMSTEVTVH